MKVVDEGQRVWVEDEGAVLASCQVQELMGEPVCGNLKSSGDYEALMTLVQHMKERSERQGMYLTIDARDARALALFGLYTRIGCKSELLLLSLGEVRDWRIS